MKEYNFEYTRQGTVYLLFLLSFGLIALSAVILTRILTNLILLDVFLSIALSIIFFLLNKRHIKKIGEAELSDSSLLLTLYEVKNIVFSELKYYYIYDGKNGIMFTLGFSDGTKFKISANNNFCNIEKFKIFITEFQLAIENYKAKNKSNIVKLESILARKNAIYVLCFLTMIVLFGFVFMEMTAMIISIALTLPLLFNWIRYFQLKNNKKLVDF